MVTMDGWSLSGPTGMGGRKTALLGTAPMSGSLGQDAGVAENMMT